MFRVSLRDESLRCFVRDVDNRSRSKISAAYAVDVNRAVSQDNQKVMHSVGLPSSWYFERYCVIDRQSSAGHVTTF